MELVTEEVNQLDVDLSHRWTCLNQVRFILMLQDHVKSLKWCVLKHTF
jgi:hypothetical protein